MKAVYFKIDIWIKCIGKLDIVDDINKNNYSHISKIFSPTVINNLIDSGYSPFLKEIICDCGLKNKIDESTKLKDFFDWVYKLLLKNYRNEYIYKNIIANKILLGKHSLNTSFMLTEFRAGNCKADVVILNGTSTVYEIKTEYDSFKRLENQLNEYLKCFDRVNIITSENQSKHVKHILPDNVGLMVLTKRNTIKTVKSPKKNLRNIEKNILFNSLRKKEYIPIIKEYYGITPDVPNTLIHNQCKELFMKIPIEDAHNLSIKYLLKRANGKSLKKFIDASPNSLSSLLLNLRLSKIKIERLLSVLNNNMSSIITI